MPEITLSQLKAVAAAETRAPLATVCMITFYAASFSSVVPIRTIVFWVMAQAGIHLLIYLNARAFLRDDVPYYDTRRWELRFQITALLFSVAFASALFVFWVPDNLLYRNYLVTSVAIVMAPLILMTISYLPIFLLTIGPIVLALMLRISTLGPSYYMQAGLLLLFLAMLIRRATQVNGTMVKSIRLQHENDALIKKLSEAKRDSDAARAHAEQANRAKSTFLANMSHELRTPLNAIIGFSDIMAMEMFGKHSKKIYKEYSTDIKQSGTHLLGLIDDILDLSRIEADRFNITEEPINIEDLAIDCCRFLEIRAVAQRVSIELDFEDNLPILMADAKAVRQIWINFLTNAVKFSPPNSVVKMIGRLDSSGELRFGVHDRGPGIDKEELANLTDAFKQGAAGIARPEKGFGLGLAIIKGLAKLHGARLDLRSNLGTGTEAEVVFPGSRLRPPPALPRETHAASAG